MEHSDKHGRHAKKAWEKIFKSVAGGNPIPTATEPHTDATPDDLRRSLIIAAAAFDEFLETGTLERGRAEQSMLNLLLVVDSLTPIPGEIVEPNTLREVLKAIRRGDWPGR